MTSAATSVDVCSFGAWIALNLIIETTLPAKMPDHTVQFVLLAGADTQSCLSIHLTRKAWLTKPTSLLQTVGSVKHAFRVSDQVYAKAAF